MHARANRFCYKISKCNQPKEKSRRIFAGDLENPLLEQNAKVTTKAEKDESRVIIRLRMHFYLERIFRRKVLQQDQAIVEQERKEQS